MIDHVVATPLALRTAKRWTDALRLRRKVSGHKRAFDLHRAAGMWLLPVTAMLAFTGIYFNLSAEFHAALASISPPASTPADQRPALRERMEEPPIDADAALAAALDGTGVVSVSNLFYDPAKAHWTIAARDSRDLIDETGGREIVVDARTGRVSGDWHFTQGSVGDAVIAWQYPLHSGKAFGWTGRILVLLAGLGTCAMILTGYLIWWRRRSARQRRVAGIHQHSMVSLAPAPAPAEQTCREGIREAIQYRRMPSCKRAGRKA